MQQPIAIIIHNNHFGSIEVTPTLFLHIKVGVTVLIVVLINLTDYMKT